MFSEGNPITDELRHQIVAAIRLVQGRVRWKPGSAEGHLLKRRLRGHLPADATLADYDRIISTIAVSDDAAVYVYWHADTAYVVVVAIIEDEHWLAMFTLDGIMETAYVVENPDPYLSKPAFEKLGLMKEVLA